MQSAQILVILMSDKSAKMLIRKETRSIHFKFILDISTSVRSNIFLNSPTVLFLPNTPENALTNHLFIYFITNY